MNKIELFIAKQICICPTTDPDCCTAPGQSEKEIAELAKVIEDNKLGELEVYEIRDVKIIERFPEVAALFKSYGYNSLPIIMVDGCVVAYGIPDKEFIISCITKSKGKNKT